MKVSISELKAKMTNILKAKGYTDENIPFVINMYLGGELRGHTSHGLSSFAAFAQSDPTAQPEPVVLKDTHAMWVLDAKGANGNILGKRIADEALTRAKNEGVGTALVHDMDSWLRPGAIAEYIAGQGYIAVVINSGGGTSVAPPGGLDPVIGTNPIAYGIPTTEEPLVVDMATAMHAWGQVRLANKYGTQLPPDAFYDDHGAITRDGKQAYSVKAAGDYKGFALGMLVEVLCGSLVDIPMMLTSIAGSTFNGKIPNRGALVTVYDPGIMLDPAEFKRRNSKLLADIQESQALAGEEIRIPGIHAGELQAARTKEDSVDIPDELWEEIRGL